MQSQNIAEKKIPITLNKLENARRVKTSNQTHKGPIPIRNARDKLQEQRLDMLSKYKTQNRYIENIRARILKIL